MSEEKTNQCMVEVSVGNIIESFCLSEIQHIGHFSGYSNFITNSKNENDKSINIPCGDMDIFKSVLASYPPGSHVISNISCSVFNVVSFLGIADFLTIKVSHTAILHFVAALSSEHMHYLLLAGIMQQKVNELVSPSVNQLVGIMQQKVNKIQDECFERISIELDACIQIETSADVNNPVENFDIVFEDKFNFISAIFFKNYDWQKYVDKDIVKKIIKKIKTLAGFQLNYQTETLFTIFKLLKLFKKPSQASKFVNKNRWNMTRAIGRQFTNWITQAGLEDFDVIEVMVLPSIDFLMEFEEQYLQNFMKTIPYHKDLVVTVMCRDHRWMEFISNLYFI